MEFSFATIENFDNHINNSIYGYDHLIDGVIRLGQYFIEDETRVYDIGCSTGKLLKELRSLYSADYYGIEIERNLSKEISNEDGITILPIDIRDYTSISNASFVTSIFTLQFIPLRDRERIIQLIYNGLTYGGAFVMSEKVYSKHSKLQDIFTFLYYDFKSKTFTPDEIMSKERDLRKIMKPSTLEDNVKLLEKVGFKTYDVFWRSMNFVGIIAIKE